MPELPRSLVEALKARSVIPFVGAGVSRAVTGAEGKPLFPTWRDLLAAAAIRLREEQLVSKAKRVEGAIEDGDFLDAAQHAYKGMEAHWIPFLKEHFDPQAGRAQPASLELARAVWRLGSPLIVTTNYDKVLRWACPNQRDLRHWTVGDKANLADIHRNALDAPVVWHLHGFIDRPEEIILTPDGYRMLYPAGDHLKVAYEAALNTLCHLFTGRTVLFIGFGMEQAIQDQIRWVKETFGGAGGKHFVLVHTRQMEAMEKELQGLPVQPLAFADYGAPLLELLAELASHVESGGLLAPPPPPPVEADPRPYLEYLRNDTAFMEMRGLKLGVAEAPRFPIEQLYIPLIDEAGGGGEMREGKARRTLEESLAESRLVILGDPGSGKTTFLRRVANQACAARLADASAPFPLILRVSEISEFIEGQERKDAPALLARLLAQQTGDLAVPLDERFFLHELTRGPCLLLVDGLDEAPNETARATVSRLLEKAARAWPNCRFAVTSRPKAYEEEVLLEGFHPARIGPLEPAAVRTFLEHWSKALIAENPKRAERHARELIKAVEGTATLRRIASNPVMLTALAVLHWNEKRMPEQRADLYESILLWLARSRQRRKGRLSAEDCIKVLQELAGAMQGHPGGRLVQAPREWAAQAIARLFAGDADRALLFLQEEEKDSGIVVNRGADVKFWHLTFQEFLAARLLAHLDPEERHPLLFAEGRAWLPEWREVTLLLAGILYQQRAEKVDALVSAALDHLYGSTLARRVFRWMGTKPGLADQARCFGLLGGMLRDLQALGYTPADPRYAEAKEAALGIFDVEKASAIPLRTRLAAADALGQAGDPRLRLPGDRDYWVEVEGFLIGRYPVTVHEYNLFVEDGGRRPYDWDRQLLQPNCPVVYVSWDGAKAYCVWAGVRLPSEAELERAARGREGRVYPWGNEPPDPTRANYDETKLGRVSPVGLFPRGSTTEGIADLAGNVWEWVEDRIPPWEVFHFPGAEASLDPTDEFCVVRGGSWLDSSRNVRASFRNGFRPGVRYFYIGFRCAREVFP